MQIDFEDFTILFTIHSHWIDYKVYEIKGRYDSNDTPLYGEEFEDWSDFITKSEISSPDLECSVKWDGCSNWDFNTDNCMKHFCGRKDIEAFNRLMLKIYDMTIEMLPTFDKTMRN